jgi:hypothetical protein
LEGSDARLHRPLDGFPRLTTVLISRPERRSEDDNPEAHLEAPFDLAAKEDANEHDGR